MGHGVIILLFIYNKKVYKMNQYLVSFLITQRGDNTDWIEHVLSSGLREGETLDTITITKLESEYHETINTNS